MHGSSSRRSESRLEPEYLPVEYDDVAIREDMAETGWGAFLEEDD